MGNDTWLAHVAQRRGRQAVHVFRHDAHLCDQWTSHRDDRRHLRSVDAVRRVAPCRVRLVADPGPVVLRGGDRLAGIRCAFVGHGDYRGDGLDSQAPRRLGELACRCRRADSALGAAIVVHDWLSAFVLRRVFDRDVCAAAAGVDSKLAATRSATAARVMAVVVAFCGSDCDTVARRVRCGLAGFAAVGGIDVQPVYAGDAARQRAHRSARWLGSGQQSWLFGFCCLASSCFGVVRPQRLAVDVFDDVAQRNGGRIAVWASVRGCAAHLADVDLRGGSCVMGVAVGAENQAPWDAGSDRLGLCLVCGGELGQSRRVHVDRAASRQRLGTIRGAARRQAAAHRLRQRLRRAVFRGVVFADARLRRAAVGRGDAWRPASRAGLRQFGYGDGLAGDVRQPDQVQLALPQGNVGGAEVRRAVGDRCRAR